MNAVGIVAVFIQSPPNFMGPNVIGLLAAQMFLGQVC